MACVDSSDEEETSARRSQTSGLAACTAVEQDGGSVTVVASPHGEKEETEAATGGVEFAEPDPDSVRKDSGDLNAEDGALIQQAVSPGGRSKRSGSVSAFFKGMRGRSKSDSSNRDRVQSDTSHYKNRGSRGTILSAEERCFAKGDAHNRVSFDWDDRESHLKKNKDAGSTPSLVDKLSKVHFRVTKSISLGVDGLTKANIKRSPTGRKHKPRHQTRSVDRDNSTGDDSDSGDDTLSVRYRKSTDRKASTKRVSTKTSEKKAQLEPIVSDSDITFRATAQRKGTTRRGGKHARSATLQEGEPVIPKNPRYRFALASKLSLGKMFLSTDSDFAGGVAKSQSNPVACLHTTPNRSRKSDGTAGPASQGAAQQSSTISSLMRKLKK